LFKGLEALRTENVLVEWWECTLIYQR